MADLLKIGRESASYPLWERFERGERKKEHALTRVANRACGLIANIIILLCATPEIAFRMPMEEPSSPSTAAAPWTADDAKGHAQTVAKAVQRALNAAFTSGATDPVAFVADFLRSERQRAATPEGEEALLHEASAALEPFAHPKALAPDVLHRLGADGAPLARAVLSAARAADFADVASECLSRLWRPQLDAQQGAPAGPAETAVARAVDVLTLIRRGLQCECAALLVLDGERLLRVATDEEALLGSAGGAVSTALAVGLAGAVARDALPVRVNADAHLDGRFDPLSDGLAGSAADGIVVGAAVHELMGVPVLQARRSADGRAGGVGGVLLAINRSAGFGGRDEALLTRVSDQLSVHLLPELLVDVHAANNALSEADDAAEDESHWESAGVEKSVYQAMMEAEFMDARVVARRGTLIPGAKSRSSLLTSFKGRNGHGAAPASAHVLPTGHELGLSVPREPSEQRVPPLSPTELFTLPAALTPEKLHGWDVDFLSLSDTELMATAAWIFRESGVLTTYHIEHETLANVQPHRLRPPPHAAAPSLLLLHITLHTRHSSPLAHAPRSRRLRVCACVRVRASAMCALTRRSALLACP
jgi:hypothetical protein